MKASHQTPQAPVQSRQRLSFLRTRWKAITTAGLGIIGVFGLIQTGLSPIHPVYEFWQQWHDAQARRGVINQHISLGNTFLNVEQLEAAQLEFTQALQLEPTNSDAQIGFLKSNLFGQPIEGQYDPEVMRQRLQYLSQSRPDDPHVLVFLGDVYLSNSNVDDDRKAWDLYLKAIKKDPNIAAAHFGMGIVLDRQGKVGDALSEYTQASNLSELNQGYLNSVGYELFRQGEYDSAITKYTSIKYIDVRYLKVYFDLANAYRVVGQAKDAYGTQKALVGKFGDQDLVALKRNQGGWTWHLLGSDPSNYYTVWPSSTKKYYALFGLALTCYILDKRDEAQSLVTEANELKIDFDEESAGKDLVRSDAAQLLRLQPQYQAAIVAFNQQFLDGGQL